jgi:hypothetical protein
MSIEFLDPTHEATAAQFAAPRRLTSLAGATIGIISNGKYGTKPFFDAFERELIERHGVATVVRRTKSNYSAPADREIMAEAQAWNVLIAGIGD